MLRTRGLFPTSETSTRKYEKHASRNDSSNDDAHLGLVDLDVAGARLQQVGRDLVAHLPERQLRPGLEQLRHLPSRRKTSRHEPVVCVLSEHDPDPLPSHGTREPLFPSSSLPV